MRKWEKIGECHNGHDWSRRLEMGAKIGKRSEEKEELEEGEE